MIAFRDHRQNCTIIGKMTTGHSLFFERNDRLKLQVSLCRLTYSSSTKNNLRNFDIYGYNRQTAIHFQGKDII